MKKLQIVFLGIVLTGGCVGWAGAQGPDAPEPLKAQVDEARIQAEKGDPAQALDRLRALAAESPPVPGAARTLGLELYRTGKLVDAVKAFTQAEAQDPADVEAVQLHGLALYRLGQPAAAIPYLKRVARYTPDANADANHVLGLCYLNARQYDDARESFAMQFGLAPGSGGAYLLLAEELLRADLPELAADASRQALTRDAHLPLAHFTLGEVLLYKSDIAGALKEFEAERALNPVYAPTYERLGDLYLRNGRLDDAQQTLLKALSLDLSSTGPFLLMGRVLLRRNDPQMALLYLQHAAKMDPSSVAAHTMLGQAYRILGDAARAKDEAEAASRLNAANQLKLTPVR